MSTTPHLYLFTLEVAPLEVGGVYNPLPSHLTLMHRFWSALTPQELSNAVASVFKIMPAVTLTFANAQLNGPQKARVQAVQLTTELKILHLELYAVLNRLSVEYTAPQWVGAGFGPHVTERPNVQFTKGQTHRAPAAYLVEVDRRPEGDFRHVRAKFDLT